MLDFSVIGSNVKFIIFEVIIHYFYSIYVQSKIYLGRKKCAITYIEFYLSVDKD